MVKTILGGDFFEFECHNELISISLDEIEDPCDLYNYISLNCPDNLDLLPGFDRLTWILLTVVNFSGDSEGEGDCFPGGDGGRRRRN